MRKLLNLNLLLALQFLFGCSFGFRTLPTDSASVNEIQCVEDPLSDSFEDFGTGTPADPFIICNAAQLVALGKTSSAWSANYKLAANIDLAVYDRSSTEKSVEPIGYFDHVMTANSLPFTGIFDGADFTVSNLKLVAASNDRSVGFFGYTLGATIKNVHLLDAEISGNRNVGILAGYNKATPVSGVFVSGTVTATGSYAGGMLGVNDAPSANLDSPVSNSSSSATVLGYDVVGGLIGLNTAAGGGKAEISNSFTTGDVGQGPVPNGNTFGGFIGYVSSTNGSAVNITGCNSAGDVMLTTNGSFSGLFVGTMIVNGSGSTGHLITSHASGTITSPTWGAIPGSIGGFVGTFKCENLAKCYIDRVYSVASIVLTSVGVSPAHIGGLFGGFAVLTVGTEAYIRDSYFNGTIQSTGTTNTNVGGLIGTITSAVGVSIPVTGVYASVGFTGTYAPTRGGLLGGVNGAPTITFNSSYWNSSLYATGSGVAVSTITARTAVQLAIDTNLSGFDFTNTWTMLPGPFPSLK